MATTAPPLSGVNLPEAYGTERLYLMARDPHWLYAHWDLTEAQLRKYNARSVDRHLVLRIFRDTLVGSPYREIPVHPESRNWFAHVGAGDTRFVAELGYYRPDRRWTRISVSPATLTPPDSLSDDLSVRFETLPTDFAFDQLLLLVKRAITDHVPLMEAILQLRAMGHTGLPAAIPSTGAPWTPEQERALAEVVSLDTVRRVWMGSLEITELIRRQWQRELSSAALVGGGPLSSEMWSGNLSSLSSPFGGMPKKGFWFNVNAELIIYGATEPDAKVTIGGRPIQLRPDGTFSYRFSLPDGQYHLPAIATSADSTDSRSAALTFRRDTQYQGEVGKHPQDARLKPPLANNLE